MTLALRQTVHNAFMLVRLVYRVLRNIVLLPVTLLRLVRHVTTSDSFEPDMEMLRDHLLIPVADEAVHVPDTMYTQDAVEAAADQNWNHVFELIETWEDAQAVTPTRTDMVYSAMDQITDLILQTGQEALDALEQATPKTQTAQHIQAALLAVTHTKIGWHWRGEDTVDTIGPADAERFVAHFDRAATLIEPFDPVLLGAPSIAIARYHLYAAHADAASTINDWFYDWVDLSPDAITPFLEHGFHLLPRWFGSNAGTLDRAALQAVSATRDRMGAAAYPLMYLSALPHAPEAGVVSAMDVDLFFDGLDDLLARCTGPRRANWIAYQLYEAAFYHLASPPKDPVEQQDEAVIALVRTRYDTFVRRHITELVPSIWGGEDEARWYIAHAYRAALEAGAVITIENGRVEVTNPEQE